MLLALLAAVAVDPGALPGFYTSSTPEVGAAIELEPDGTFAYSLDYGAVSENAEGRWAVDGDRVVITATKIDGAGKGATLDHVPLVIDGSSLLLQRYSRTIRFDREGELTPPPNRNTQLEKKD